MSGIDEMTQNNAKDIGGVLQNANLLQLILNGLSDIFGRK